MSNTHKVTPDKVIHCAEKPRILLFQINKYLGRKCDAVVNTTFGDYAMGSFDCRSSFSSTGSGSDVWYYASTRFTYRKSFSQPPFNNGTKIKSKIWHILNHTV